MPLTKTCEQCHKGYPDVRVETYYSAIAKHHICDVCLFAELRTSTPSPTVTYATDARYFVDPQGREFPFPSYAT